MIRNLFILVNIFLYILALFLWLIFPTQFNVNVPLTIFTLLLSIFLLIPYRKNIQLYILSLHFRKVLTLSLQVSLVLSILGLVNFIAFKKKTGFDLTANKINTLSEQTRNMLFHFPGAIKTKIFIRRQEQNKIVPLLKLYQLEKQDFSFEVIDPDLRPDLVQKYNIQQYGAIILEGNEKSQLALGYDEKTITLILTKMAREKDPVICWNQDHEEIQLNDTSKQGISYLKNLLKENNYNILPFSLLSSEKISNSCSMYTIVSPKVGFSQREIEKISSYIENGGKLLLAMGPETYKNKKLGTLRRLMNQYGVTWHNELVIDGKNFVSGSKGMVPIIKDFNRNHPLTAYLGGQVFFPLSSHFSIENVNTYKWTPILRSSENSYAEKDFKKLTREEFSETITGPKIIMLAGDHNQNDGQIALIGNGSFLTNHYTKFPSQFHLLLNVLSWMTEDSWTMKAKDLSIMKAEIPKINSFQINIIFVCTVFLFPLLALISSILIYMRRRKK